MPSAGVVENPVGHQSLTGFFSACYFLFIKNLQALMQSVVPAIFEFLNLQALMQSVVPIIFNL